jgi:hypothetical protein
MKLVLNVYSTLRCLTTKRSTALNNMACPPPQLHKLSLPMGRLTSVYPNVSEVEGNYRHRFVMYTLCIVVKLCVTNYDTWTMSDLYYITSQLQILIVNILININFLIVKSLVIMFKKRLSCESIVMYITCNSVCVTTEGTQLQWIFTYKRWSVFSLYTFFSLILSVCVSVLDLCVIWLLYAEALERLQAARRDIGQFQA